MLSRQTPRWSSDGGQQGCEHVGVKIFEIVAGALLILWPLQWRRTMSRVLGRVVERGGDVERFDQGMRRPLARAPLVIVPFAGVGLIILGIAS